MNKPLVTELKKLRADGENVKITNKKTCSMGNNRKGKKGIDFHQMRTAPPQNCRKQQKCRNKAPGT